MMHAFENLPAQLDNHGSQDHEITCFLQEQLLLHETPQEKDTRINVWTEGWPKVTTDVKLGILM
jgi:hypothetical protein